MRGDPFPRRGRVTQRDPQSEGVHVHLARHRSSWSFGDARVFFAEPGSARNKLLCNKQTPLRGVSAVGSVQLLRGWNWYEEAPDGAPAKAGPARYTSRPFDEAKGPLIILLRWASGTRGERCWF